MDKARTWRDPPSPPSPRAFISPDCIYKCSHRVPSVRWNVCCRAITALVNAVFPRRDATRRAVRAQHCTRLHPARRGGIKFILDNSCRVTCSNSRVTWLGAITNPRRQPRPGENGSSCCCAHFVRVVKSQKSLYSRSGENRQFSKHVEVRVCDF